jgi:hypothetical protein
MLLRQPDEPTTPAQWKVIAWAAIFVFVVLGGIAVFYSFRAPAAKAELAGAIRWYGLAFWALAAAIYGVKRLVERFLSW